MIDRVFGGRYRLTERIGIGGMAEVYKASDEVLGRTVAVKVMLPQYAADPTFATRFKQEAQAAANLQSPYIVNIYDWGQEAGTERAEGTYYIVMEYIRGTDLKTAIEQRGAINQRKVAEIGSQVCSALSVAHSYDVIHRDIKPHNLMIQPDGNTKVMDFGIARANNSNLTQTGSVLGTAYYVSPEQAQGKQLSVSTDIYSLGVCLYEAATGQLPFDGPDAVSIAVKHVSEQPRLPREVNPSIDPVFEAIIMRAMSKDPAQRFSTVEQMRVALNDYLAGRLSVNAVGGDARTQVMGAGAGSAAAKTTVTPRAQAAGMAPVNGTTVMPPLAGRGSNSSSFDSEEEDNLGKKVGIAVGVAAALLIIIVAALIIINPFGAPPEPEDGEVLVPSVTRMTLEEATEKLEDAKLEVGEVEEEYSDTIEEGEVISQDPRAGEPVAEGSKVNLVVSKGADLIEMPELLNLSQAQAEARLKELGLDYTIEQKSDPDVDEGKVCGQSVEAGEKIRPTLRVTVFVSSGPGSVNAPDVRGLSKADAKAQLETAGFKVKFAKEIYSSEYEKGLVVVQSPDPYGGPMERGETITLTVSKGPEPAKKVKVPAVRGMTLSQAQSQLQAVGLIIDYKGIPGANQRVDTQDPSAGTSVDVGSIVTVTFADPEPVSPPTPVDPAWLSGVFLGSLSLLLGRLN
ncbi:MAG: Stk1 family PASTA domain-containing Ser/Thr kinase [Coriobacteriia bacterium]|nr:Stk1 family PASTA domain-containing Ser/Thr kinase [Coriobacteriia bacterium]